MVYFTVKILTNKTHFRPDCKSGYFATNLWFFVPRDVLKWTLVLKTKMISTTSAYLAHYYFEQLILLWRQFVSWQPWTLKENTLNNLLQSCFFPSLIISYKTQSTFFGQKTRNAGWSSSPVQKCCWPNSL